LLDLIVYVFLMLSKGVKDYFLNAQQEMSKNNAVRHLNVYTFRIDIHIYKI